MKERKNYFDRLAFQADLPGEALPGQPLVEIAGDCRVLVENHRGVIAYSCEKILIKVSYGQLCVCGTGLMLACMSKHQLVITGRISNVAVIRGR